ncbi:MAG: hypothetical protein RBS37_12240 [Bacteroidales bacterium]|jgi:hypothetical protein|nr:hypothetical protein [Bacteroidales bacterium]
MKKFVIPILILMSVFFVPAYGQIADGITYQAVAVDVNGKEIAGKDIHGSVIYEREIGVRFSVIEGTDNGDVLYCEEHSTFTDQNGLFTLVIGQGEASPDGRYQKLSDIQWGADKLFLKVELKTYSSPSYVLTGIQQMMAVPFAFYALRSSGTTVDYSDIINKPTLSSVATSGNYDDLYGTPVLSPLAVSGNYNDLVHKPAFSQVATTGNFSDLLNRPAFSTVATSGNYNDLIGRPVFSQVAVSGNYNDLLNRPVLAPVATSGSFSDLLNCPLLSAVATSGDFGDLNNTPELSDVATSGDYNDLINRPSFASVAFSGAYLDLTGLPSFSVVATSGNYNDLSNRPILFDGDYNSLTNKPAVIRETTDEFSASTGQTTFYLRNTPAATSLPRMFINGIRISNQAYSISGTSATYIPVNNGSYSLTTGDRIQFDYSY